MLRPSLAGALLALGFLLASVSAPTAQPTDTPFLPLAQANVRMLPTAPRDRMTIHFHNFLDTNINMGGTYYVRRAQRIDNPTPQLRCSSGQDYLDLSRPFANGLTFVRAELENVWPPEGDTYGRTVMWGFQAGTGTRLEGSRLRIWPDVRQYVVPNGATYCVVSYRVRVYVSGPAVLRPWQ